MEFRQHLIETFTFNDKANRQMLGKIKLLPNNAEAVKFFSHLINSQYKWMARITQDPKAQEMHWWKPAYQFDELEAKWHESLALWLSYLNNTTDKELLTEVTFIGFDGSLFAATPGDIALQLNYHSIHHRAQIQTILRAQNIEPDFIDYIGTKYRKL